MKRILFVAIVLILGGRAATAEEGPPDLSVCRPEAAWVVPLGDHKPTLQSEPLPAPVADRLNAIGSDYYRRLGNEWLGGNTCAALYGAIYRFPARDGRQLFGVRISKEPIGGAYEYFLFDPRSGSLSPSNLRLDFTSWSERDPSRRENAPSVSFADLYRNGRQQMVIEEHKHNGTSYDCFINHYFGIGRDLSLNRVFALERDSLIGDTRPRPYPIGYKRRLSIQNGNQLRIDTSIGHYGEPGSEKPLGYAILASPAPGAPFRVISRHPIHAEDERALVETSRSFMPDDDDDRFLREGCPDC
jgi:hypothetical protein